MNGITVRNDWYSHCGCTVVAIACQCKRFSNKIIRLAYFLLAPLKLREKSIATYNSNCMKYSCKIPVGLDKSTNNSFVWNIMPIV